MQIHQAQQPDPAAPQTEPAHPSMVYVYEDQAWEYKLVARGASQGWRLPEQELNALGDEGWELAAIASVPDAAHFYFKRPRK